MPLLHFNFVFDEENRVIIKVRKILVYKKYMNFSNLQIIALGSRQKRNFTMRFWPLLYQQYPSALQHSDQTPW